MNKKTGWIKRIGCLALVGMMACSQTLPAWATAAKAEQEKKEAQKQLEEANKKANEAQANKNAVQSQVSQLNSELTTLLTEINFLEVDMEQKEAEIAQAEIDFAAAKKKEEEQYAAMKKRIQYMYEKGNTEYLDVLLQVKSMADLLNKAEYVDAIYSYDRNMLDEYEATKQQVAAYQEQLINDKAEMEVMDRELKGQKGLLETTIANKRKEVSDFDSQLAQAQKDAAAFAKTVEQKNTQIRKAKEEEAKRQAEEARKQAEAAKKNSSSGKSSSSAKNTSGKKSSAGPAASKSSGGTAAGRAVADYGLKFVGNPYVYGGTSLTEGADCSGYTQAIYRNFGISLPRTSSEQRSVGTEVAYEDAQPGDLICYAGHVAIYIGNGQIVHASTPATGIRTGNATYRTILSVRRVL